MYIFRKSSKEHKQPINKLLFVCLQYPCVTSPSQSDKLATCAANVILSEIMIDLVGPKVPLNEDSILDCLRELAALNGSSLSSAINGTNESINQSSVDIDMSLDCDSLTSLQFPEVRFTR